ncbi:tRNA modification GTPase TrmE [Spiroplasma clarkii]|uniref:tRNA modification GTPase MnmE n=1 Tax=Spiroplasma clarkii TaxID=2139 RepID=A0A2K8KLZ6_9MOLU|nr:tRNA uridine-5-carboxymethylaminomethyl(34) synthesis GTPase MnmE [Spiroplasma clarkii]ATX71679.1 tRNA modification GTPase TrmE [Spiroplasma clarkii]
MILKFNDTIVAPATKLAKQAISIIRLSGPEAFEIVNKIIKKPLQVNNSQQLRKIYEDDQLIDEALLITFVETKSFTGEFVVEINCHGGILLANKILALLIKNGARMALNGEFSQRAFMNGKIDLLQAEGINNLIESRNNLAIKINALNATGSNNQNILKIKENLIDVISKIQTTIDYPEYDDIEGLSPAELAESLAKTKSEVEKIIEVSQRVLKINDGINTLILGEPNVGKSSLLNALLNEDKAIVTDIKGTTRDIIEGQINFDNFSLNLIDTAGIRKTTNKIEKIGIEKSLKLIDTADLILLVVDSLLINQEIYQKIQNKQHIVVVNKAKSLSDTVKTQAKKEYNNIVFINAIDADIEELLQKIKQIWANDDILQAETTIITNIDNIGSLKRAAASLDTAIVNLNSQIGIDIVMVDLYESLNTINTMLGIVDTDEEVINNTFRKYCLGK